MNVVEMVNTNPTSTERGNKRQIVRVYKAWPTNTVAAKTAVGDDGTIIPKIGEFHPAETSTTVDRISADYEGGSDRTVIVSVFYSNDRSWRAAPTMDVLRNGFKSWTVTADTVSIPYPVGVWNAKLGRYAGVDGEKFISGWEIVERPTKETRTTIQRRIVLNRLDVGDIAMIVEQANKIHVIRGKPYRFSSGDIIQLDGDGIGSDYDNKWETSYIWEGDNGVIAYPPILPKYADVMFIPKPLDGSPFARPPFTEFVVLPPDDPDGPGGPELEYKRPTFVPQGLYDVSDPLGWTKLPGDLDL